MVNGKSCHMASDGIASSELSESGHAEGLGKSGVGPDFGEDSSQKIPQPRKLYDVLGGQNAQNKRRLGSGVDFVQVARRLWLAHELQDALIERAGYYRVRPPIRTALIVERRPFPQLRRAAKLMETSPVIVRLSNRIATSRRNGQAGRMAARFPTKGNCQSEIRLEIAKRRKRRTPQCCYQDSKCSPSIRPPDAL
jgi:hypothetical protein